MQRRWDTSLNLFHHKLINASSFGDSQLLADAGAVAIFGPGTVISDSAIKMLDLLIAARKQA